MTGETRMSSKNCCRKEETDGADCTSSGKCSRKWKLRQETNDGRLLTDGTTGRAAAAWTMTADGDDLAGYLP